MRRIVIHPSYKGLSSFIEDIPNIFDLEGTLIFQGRNQLKHYRINDIDLIVKRFKRPHILNRFVYVTIRLSKAARSYKNALRLETLKITTPTPVAYIEERSWGLSYSYYITTELKNMVEIRNIHSLYNEEDAYKILTAFGNYTARLHKQGILHKDYSAGNILFRMEEGQIYFSLVDINRMRFGAVSTEQGYKNFERLWLSDSDFVTIAKAYAQERNLDPEEAIKRICFYKNQFMRQ